MAVAQQPCLSWHTCIGACMCCMMRHSGMFSCRTWRWVSQHVQARQPACCFFTVVWQEQKHVNPRDPYHRAQCSIPWGHRCRRSGSSFSSSLCPCLCLCPAAGSSESFQGSTCQILFQALTRIVVINLPWTHRPMPRAHGVFWYTDTPTHWCWFGLHPTIALTLTLP